MFIRTGIDISICELADLIKNILDFKGGFFFNKDKPDGVMKKLTDISKLNNLGWKYEVALNEGLERLYKWYTS